MYSIRYLTARSTTELSGADIEPEAILLSHSAKNTNQFEFMDGVDLTCVAQRLYIVIIAIETLGAWISEPITT